MLCRICVDNSDVFLYIFDTNGEQLGIADILGRHFWFKPQPDDAPSTTICSNCWLKVYDFHQFYLSIEQKQREFCEFIMKHKSCTNLIDNEFIDSNSNIKATPDIANESEGNSDSEPFNPLQELDFESEKEKEPCIKSEQPKHECETHTECNIEEKIAQEKSKPVRKRKKCVDENPISEPNPKRGRRKAIAVVEATEKMWENDEKIQEKPKRAHRKNIKVAEPTAKICSNEKAKEKNCIKSRQEDDEIVKKFIQMNCELCSYVSEDYPALRKHFREEHPNVKAYVRCCNKKHFDRLYIVQHAYKHDDPEFFKCKTCEKTFSEKSTLSRHIVAVHGTEEDLKFRCEQCPKKFARQKLLDLHVNSHVPMEERTFICDQCPNSRFASSDLLKYHMGSRHRRPPNVCHVCAKVIRDKASFERHVREHFEAVGPKLKCLIDGCDHWLKDENNLRRHMRLHTAEKRILTCEICGRECKDKSALNNHRRRVHATEVFTCGECQKTFKRAVYLREHMAQHTGESLYKCPFCTRTFNSAANMHAHKKKIHPAEWDMWRKTNNASLIEFSRQQKSV